MSGAKKPDKIYHVEKFETFIKMIETGAAEHWVEIARALNVEENTITAWKQRPEAQAAIRKGIERALKEMEKAGAKDWRMWESKLKMLGVSPVNKAELEVRNPIGEILGKYGLSDAGETSETTS